MLPDLHTNFSRGRSGGLVFPSLSEFSTVYCDPHKSFGKINKAEIDVFLELSCFFHDPADVGNSISGSSAFSKTSLNIRKFTVHILLKPGLENFEHYFTSVWDQCNCVVVWAFFGIAFLWDWKKNCQNASKFGKLSSGHRTGKGQFSFQSQRKGIKLDDLKYSDQYDQYMVTKE